MREQCALPVRIETVVDALARVTRESPNALALSDGTLTARHGDLARAARRLAVGLRARGIGRDSLVAIGLPRSIDRIVATLGIWQAGAAMLPLDPAWPEARIARIVDDAGCGLVIGGPGGASVAELSAEADASAGDQAIAADDLAYVIYTSGSSGRPKGVEITHGNLAALIAWHNQAFAIAPADRATHLAGLAFDAAIWEVWPYLAAGASVHLAPEAARGSAEALRDWLVAVEATIAFAPTLMAEQLVRLRWPETPCLRTLLTGGDRLRTAPPAGLPFRLVNNYGPAECTIVATSGPVAPAADTPSIGRPIAGTVIRILDQAGQPAAPDAVGEIWIGGASVGRGYRGEPALTAASFVRDPLAIDPDARCYRTGDLGSLHADGTIAFHGRIDDQLQIRGQRIEPEEVAAALALVPGVAAAAVVGVEGPDGPALVGYVVPADGMPPAAEAVRDALAAHLPDWAIPAAFVALEALPVTANGKLDRRALPPPSDANALPRRAHADAATIVEERLLAILSDILGQRAIGVDDNFFLLGGHSLLGTQVVLRASDSFGVELTLRHLFHAPTVRQLARVIEGLVEELVAAMSDDELLLHAGG